MSEQPQFSIKVDQNKFLPEGGREVHAHLAASPPRYFTSKAASFV